MRTAHHSDGGMHATSVSKGKDTWPSARAANNRLLGQQASHWEPSKKAKSQKAKPKRRG
jgi:hypothetical protein